MKTIVFISDFFQEDLIGGAELNDSVLIRSLEKKGLNVLKIKSNLLTEKDIFDNDYFIVSNFVGLSEKNKILLQMKKYIIYEHDHKYIRTRDPSKFTDFEVPEREIINKDFYSNADKIIVLSKVCKDILEKTLKLNNVISIGTSLWSEEKLSYIESICMTEKGYDFCILNSKNTIKGTREAIQYAENNNLKYELLEPSVPDVLLKHMSKYETFIFIPKVLETLSRIVVEAKMLNCKVLTNKRLIGAAYEPWFKLSGKELISEIRQRVKDAIQVFYDLCTAPEITVILNCYRRPENLKQQIESLRSQTIYPKEIWLWINHHEDNRDFDFSNLDVDKIIKNNYNWKFFGRFSACFLAKTEYIALFDDDTIPGNRWFENCINTIKTHNGILGGAGVKLNGNKYHGHDRFGWSSNNEEVVEVDLVGHAWFFRKEWMKYMWMEEPFTYENGEDIHFCYAAKKYGDIKTYCPPHPKNNIDFSSSTKGYELGVDEKATSNQRNHFKFYTQRDAIVLRCLQREWKK